MLIGKMHQLSGFHGVCILTGAARCIKQSSVSPQCPEVETDKIYSCLFGGSFCLATKSYQVSLGTRNCLLPKLTICQGKKKNQYFYEILGFHNVVTKYIRQSEFLEINSLPQKTYQWAIVRFLDSSFAN